MYEQNLKRCFIQFKFCPYLKMKGGSLNYIKKFYVNYNSRTVNLQHNYIKYSRLFNKLHPYIFLPLMLHCLGRSHTFPLLQIMKFAFNLEMLTL